jgi:hypothetical protein
LNNHKNALESYEKKINELKYSILLLKKEFKNKEIINELKSDNED